MNRSERPFIFNHMEISLDGKIMGKYLWIPETNTESDPFYRTIFGPEAKFTFQAIVEGRTTIEDNQTGYAVPEVDENAAPVPEGDYLAPGASCGMDKEYHRFRRGKGTYCGSHVPSGIQCLS